MSINVGDRLKWNWDARNPLLAGRKARVAVASYWGLFVKFEDEQFPFVRAIEFRRDWTADISFYRGVTVSQDWVGGWTAVYEGDEESPDRYGTGGTREDALSTLGEKLLERVDDRLYDLVAAGEVDDDVFTDIDGLAYLPY
jgi:hypothetical protein